MNKMQKEPRKPISIQLDIHQIVIGTLIVVIVAVMGRVTPYFFSLGNLEALLNSFVLEAIMALGMTLVIISGGIDLSISGVLPLSAIGFALLLKNNLPIAVAAGIVLLLAGLIGLTNNTLRRVLNIHPFIITTATMLLLKGLSLALTDGKVISKLPESFMKFVGLEPLGIPFPILVFMGLAVFYFVFLKHNKTFVRVYFVGGNIHAARLSGINTERVLAFVYAQSALLAGLAGILAVSIYNSASSNFGQGAELRVITAVAIGGTSLTRGGIGKISGTLLGSLFLALTYNAFIMSGISTYYQDVITGAMLILAIVFSEQAKKLRSSVLERVAQKIVPRKSDHMLP